MTPPPGPEEVPAPVSLLVELVESEVPPPVAGVVVTGVVVAGVVLAEVAVSGVVVTDPEEVPVVVEPVVAVEPLESGLEFELPALSRLLLVSVGTIGIVVEGTLSATLEPPQAASAAAARTAPMIVSERRREPRVMRSPSERTHATPAGRAVVEVALGELLAPRAEAKVLNGPRQLGLRRRERQHAADDLERLAGFGVGVDAVCLGLDDQLSAGRGRAQAVAVTSAHRDQS
jgi:pyruvate/2-oxoglutarate dehydrogenase complex dihydrolipoamide acyltransferase (E2) component